MGLKTLDQFNAGQRQKYEEQRRASLPHPNGIECPMCKGELWDSSPTVTLTSMPPQKNVHCPTCGWRGYRLA